MKRCSVCGGIFDDSELAIGLCKTCHENHLFKIAISAKSDLPLCITTNDELIAYIKQWDNGAPVWIEYRNSKWINRALLKDSQPDYDDILYEIYFIRETIGIDWRAWRVEATKEQRNDVPWPVRPEVVITEPCPFCNSNGEPNIIVTNNSDNPKLKRGYWFTCKMACSKCGKEMLVPGVYYSEQDAEENAIRTWNRESKKLRVM